MSIKNSPLYAESWNVAYRFLLEGSIITDKDTPFIVIPNSKKFWAADPMVFGYQEQIYIFAELYDYKLCRGTIGYTVYNGKHFSKWKQVIVEEFHMSYPNVFMIDDEIFMIPETSAANELLLYKAVDFPEHWKRIKTIKSGVQWVDTTLFPIKEGYIGFTEDVSEPEKDYKLWFTKDLQLLSEEIIAEGTSVYRCAGRFFLYDKFIVHPCQDCVEKYGAALIFRFYDDEISHEFKSVRITPEQLKYSMDIFLDGIHTYTSLQKIEIIDIKTRRFNIYNLFYRLINKIR